MMQRIGGILIIALGGALITTGFSSGGGTVGEVTADCGAQTVGETTICPLGHFTFNESDVINGATQSPTASAQIARGPQRTAPPTAPSGWTVTITSSNCIFPNGTSQTVTVPDGGSASSDDFYVYTDSSGSTSCNYSYAETAVAGWTSGFSPAAPQPLAYDPNGPSNTNIALTNSTSYTTAPTTAPVTTSPTIKPTHSEHPEPVETYSATVAPPVAVSATPEPSVLGTSTAVLPDTGASHTGLEIVIGIALCLIGAAITFASGRRRKDAS